MRYRSVISAGCPVLGAFSAAVVRSRRTEPRVAHSSALLPDQLASCRSQ